MGLRLNKDELSGDRSIGGTDREMDTIGFSRKESRLAKK
jgi:hypothetical protein